MRANDTQIGGDHYKKGGEEHWDRAWRLKYDCFQYIITKWLERWREKGGLQDLYKARHALDKYIEVVEVQERTNPAPQLCRGCNEAMPPGDLGAFCEDCNFRGAEGPGPGYVNQD